MNQQINILITDNDQETVNVIACVLETQGYSVSTSHSWCEVIHRLNNSSVDIALIDIDMTDMNYQTGIAAIKNASPNTKVIATPSIELDNRTMDKLSDMGTLSVLPRPFDLNELVCALEFIALDLDPVNNGELAYAHGQTS